MRYLLFILTCVCGLAQNPIDLAAFSQVLYPTQVAGLKIWLSADFGCFSNRTGDLCTHGTGVSLWTDQSGNGNDVGHTTFANQPKYFTNQINGLPAIAFGAGTSVMSNQFVQGNFEQPMTFFVVAYPSNGSSGLVFSELNANPNPRLQWAGWPRLSFGGLGPLDCTSVSQFPVWYQWTGKFIFPQSRVFAFSKPRPPLVTLETNGCTNICVGGLRMSTPIFQGRLAELIGFGGRQLIPDEQLGIEMYLKRKYNGITNQFGLPQPF